ncbi:Arv1-like family-domain-containing protein [Massariosphaeria phaeospora]|uniref:Protein ARV n=1 Tax=Massariosphaeria phaeospora TaxID=100035 RepID=A0A7C8IJ25_9PLEO|nr:Arv1-like family-domain-containing protein [Massariosphaeria phaeospora]
MPICIECRAPVKTLYTEYSKADDRSLGKGVRLTQCRRCRRFADKYVEHDFVVLFIDLVLIKPQVYRHLLFNRLGREDDKFDTNPSPPTTALHPPPRHPTPPLRRLPHLGAHRETRPPHPTYHNLFAPPPPPTNALLLQAQPLILQYLFFLLLVTTSTLAFHFPIRLLCSLMPPRSSYLHTLIPHYPSPTPLSTALLVSSCTKLFPILLIIWEYDLPSSATAVSWAVIVNNVAALEILMDCGYGRAGVLVAVGAGCRWVVEEAVLRGVGLGTGWEGLGWVGGLLEKG